MDENVRTYDPKKVIATFAGIPISGYAEGTFINISPSSGPAFEKVRGADGGVDRVNKNSSDYTITITLKQTSPTNLAFSTALTADKLTNQGKGPFLLKDLAGTTVFTAPQSWISDDPSADYGDTMSNREWTLHTGKAASVQGGNK